MEYIRDDEELYIPLNKISWSGEIILSGTQFLLDMVRKEGASIHHIYEKCDANGKKYDVNIVGLVPEKCSYNLRHFFE